MRRAARTLAIFLFLGALTNLAVAWGLVIHYVHFDVNKRSDGVLAFLPAGDPEWEIYVTWRPGGSLAYPMGESLVCSECGCELRVRHATLPSSHPRPSPSPPP